MSRAALLPAALAAALALAACGRAGAPAAPPPPPDAALVPLDADDPGSEEVPRRRFVLDPLLQ